MAYSRCDVFHGKIVIQATFSASPSSPPAAICADDDAEVVAANTAVGLRRIYAILSIFFGAALYKMLMIAYYKKNLEIIP